MLVQEALCILVHLFEVDDEALDREALLKELCQRVKLALSHIVWDHQLDRSVAQRCDKLLEVLLEHLQLELARIAHTSILFLQNLLHLLVDARHVLRQCHLERSHLHVGVLALLSAAKLRNQIGPHLEGLLGDLRQSLTRFTLVEALRSISCPGAVSQTSTIAIVKRILDELIRVDELLHVVLVEAGQELKVDLREVELLQRVLEVGDGELLPAARLNVDRVHREATLKVVLLSQALLDVDLEVENGLRMRLDILGDDVRVEGPRPLSVDLRPEGAELRLSADFRTEL